MRVCLITGNPGSGKSTLAAELSRRGLVAIDTDVLAFWEDSSGLPVDRPPDADDGWLLAHRWVWSRARIEEAITASDDAAGLMFFCGIARNTDQMLDLFEKVFLLVIEEDTQNARLAQATSPPRTEAVKRQIREGRIVFQAQMLASGAIPLDGTASPAVVADSLLALLCD
jgi:adenylate kinase family enzyme